MGPECRGGAAKKGIRFPKAKYKVHHGHVEFVGVEQYEGPLGGNNLPPRPSKKEINIMMTGMYWQSKQALEISLRKAIVYYRNKYGRVPNSARVNPAVLTVPEAELLGVVIKPMREIPLNVLWLGVEEAARGVERASADLLRQVKQ
jgi:hypothetical protein